MLFTHYLRCSVHLIYSVHYYQIIFIFCFQLITPKFPAVVKIGHAHSGVGKVSWVPNHFPNYWLIYDTMYRQKPMSYRVPIILQIKVNFHFIFLGVFGSLINGLLFNFFDIVLVEIIFNEPPRCITKMFNFKAVFLRTSFIWINYDVNCMHTVFIYSSYQRKMIIRKADIKFTLKFTWNWHASFSHKIHVTCLN